MQTGKLLIVDDDRNLLELMRMRLESANYEVTAAADETEAREAVQQTVFDLAVRAAVLFEHHHFDAALGERTRDFGARDGSTDHCHGMRRLGRTHRRCIVTAPLSIAGPGKSLPSLRSLTAVGNAQRMKPPMADKTIGRLGYLRLDRRPEAPGRLRRAQKPDKRHHQAFHRQLLLFPETRRCFSSYTRRSEFVAGRH
jgi:hypothetical protein